MDLLISVICYLFVVVVVLFLSTYKFRLKTGNGATQYDTADLKNHNSNRISFVTILIISFVFVLYNVIVTKMNATPPHDRQIYILDFHGYRVSPSVGLTFIIDFVHSFSHNVEYLFYLSTLITVFLTFVAFRIDEEARPRTLLFLLSTQYFFFGLEALKQAYANAFAVLCISLTLRSQGKKDTVLAIVSIILAICFHHTGYFLIPIYILLRIKKNKKTILISFLILILSILFFEPVLLRIASLVSPYASYFSQKIYQYFGEAASDDLQREGLLTFVKGFPFYVLTIVGWFKRTKLVDKVRNYDNYLFLSGMLSFSYLATVYNSWVYRLSYYFFLPTGVFYVILLKNIENHRNKILFILATIGTSALITLRFVMLMYFNYGGF